MKYRWKEVFKHSIKRHREEFEERSSVYGFDIL